MGSAARRYLPCCRALSSLLLHAGGIAGGGTDLPSVHLCTANATALHSAAAGKLNTRAEPAGGERVGAEPHVVLKALRRPTGSVQPKQTDNIPFQLRFSQYQEKKIIKC